MRSQNAENLLKDEAKARRMYDNGNYDRFDNILTVSFWKKLAELLAEELEAATK